MFSFTRQLPLGILFCCAVSSSFAAGPAIGMAIANGGFEVNHSKVWGNATLFDGNVIETNVSSSRLKLNSGVKMQLASESRARVYASRLVLEKGIGQLESANYSIEADKLQVSPDKTGATARVLVVSSNRVTVAAREGMVRVNNSEGVLIAKLSAGHEMTFEPQADGSVTVTRVSGILAVKDGKFVVVDRVTNVTMQLQGTGLEDQVGNLVEITGTVDAEAPTVAGASQLIDVTKVTRLVKGAGALAENGGAAGGGTGAGAGAGAAAGASGGLSTGATVAIVGGVAAAGTVGGLAAAGALPGQGSSKPSTSR